MYVLFASYGNDSIALIHYAHINKLNDVHVVFSDTGWAADWWLDRVVKGEKFAKSYGFKTYRTESEGMLSLVKRKKGWPMGGGGAYCTAELKVIPGCKWLDKYDPDNEATCLTGVRREESQNRRDAPEWITESERHNGRELWQPLVRYSEAERDALIIDAGWKVLPHRSKECWPCVHANTEDLRGLSRDQKRIDLIDITEKEMGINSKGNPRVMFRPKRHQGATGINEVIEWACRDKFVKGQDDMFCTSGWCGM